MRQEDADGFTVQSRETQMTAEELFRRPDLDPCELVEGRIVTMTPTGFTHGGVELELGMSLGHYAKATGRGRVLVGEVGLFVRRDPDTVRAADLLFISNGRFFRQGPSPYLDVPPELVVEILSPDDRWSDVMEKLGDDFTAGVDRVWVVDPRLRKVFAYTSLNEVETIGEKDVLVDEEILPGYSCRVAALFNG
jgi:Uma2 family endonuclease